MQVVARAFTGAALFVGGLDISPTFAAEKPQALVPPSINPPLQRPGVRMRAYLRSLRSCEVISSTVPEEAADKGGKKSVSPANVARELGRSNPLAIDVKSGCGSRNDLTSSTNARRLRRATRSSPIECFTTSRRKFSEHFI
jgi:hypothetical protein